MGALGIRVDPTSIPGSQSQPQEYQATKGRVARDARVDFHWLDGAVVDWVEKKRPVSPSSGEDGAAGRAVLMKKRKKPPQDPVDYKDMTIGQIMQVIERQKAVIASQRESIRRMTEGGPTAADQAADNTAALEVRYNRHTPSFGWFGCVERPLQADNLELDRANKKLKAELRELRRANDDLREELGALRKS